MCRRRRRGTAPFVKTKATCAVHVHFWWFETMMETWNDSTVFLRDEPRQRNWAVGILRQSSSSGRAVQSRSWNSLLISNSIWLLLNTKERNFIIHFNLIMATKRREEPARQRYQANARERDRTHRYNLCLLLTFLFLFFKVFIFLNLFLAHLHLYEL